MAMHPMIKDLYLSADAVYPKGDMDPKDENTDVIVLLEESDETGKKSTAKYIASFFAYDNIPELQSRHLSTGEYLNGKYFYSKNMLLIDDCSMQNVQMVVDHMLDEGEFWEVFERM
jgi:hypothetical protein